MTLWERILQGITAFSVDTIVSLVAGVLTAKLVFHYLPPADYGQLALFLSFYATATVFLSFGLGGVFTATISRARGKGEHGWAKFLIVRYLLILLITATVLLLIFVGIGFWRRDPLLWSIMGTYLWLTAPNTAAFTIFHSATRYRRLAGQSITRNVSRLALLATLPWWWPGERLVGVALTYPLMELTVMLVSSYMTRVVWVELKDIPTSTYDNHDLISLFQKQGVYATLITPVKKVADQLPIWFLKALIGDVGVGTFAAAQKAYRLIFAFFRSLETTLFPLVSERAETHSEQLRVAMRQAQKYTFWLGLLVAIAANLTGAWIILLIAGKQYSMVIPVFDLFVWHLLIYAFSQSQRPIFYAVGQQKWLLVTYLFSTVVKTALLLIGIRLLGVMGAVWAVLLSSMVVVSVRYFLTRRVAPHLWVDPRGIIRVEEFDLRLWRDLKRTAYRVLKGAQNNEEYWDRR